MPYGAGLRALGWWYAQLLGESLGKKFDNHGNIIYNGRIPVACVGTTDMHSLTQEHQQGKKNKIVQFISVRNLPDKADFFCDNGRAEWWIWGCCLMPLPGLIRRLWHRKKG